MKIIDLLKELYSEEQILKAVENVKDFDITKFDVEEIFEAVKPEFAKSENWDSFGPISACNGVNRSIAKIEKLEDGKLYPNIYMEILISSCGYPYSVILEFTPFCCDEARGSFTRVELEKNLTKAFRKFMVEKFGKIYIEKNNEFYRTVKENETEKILNDATQRIENVKTECGENMIGL